MLLKFKGSNAFQHNLSRVCKIISLFLDNIDWLYEFGTSVCRLEREFRVEFGDWYTLWISLLTNKLTLMYDKEEEENMAGRRKGKNKILDVL